MRDRPEIPVASWPAAVPDLSVIGDEIPPYRKTFAFPGEFIDADHAAIASLPVEGGLIRAATKGFLRLADALALYEHAYFADGDVLEMGSAWGLSTTILCRAARNAGAGYAVHAIEIEKEFRRATAVAVRANGLESHYRSLPGDAGIEADRLIARGRTFGFVFVDHDHAYEPTRRVCRQLGALLQPGGRVLFHDFIDVRNRTEPSVYGVHRAVCELARDPDFEFLGVMGCSGLLRKRPR
jgi:predicted O-methyltransferase YrrM